MYGVDSSERAAVNEQAIEHEWERSKLVRFRFGLNCLEEMINYLESECPLAINNARNRINYPNAVVIHCVVGYLVYAGSVIVSVNV